MEICVLVIAVLGVACLMALRIFDHWVENMEDSDDGDN